MSSALVLSSLIAAAAPPSAQAPTWSFHLDHVLGTSFDMAVAAPSQAEAQFAFAAATTEIARLDRILSGWREDSELSALNRASAMQVSPELFAVVSACEGWRARTGGAFSARLGHAEQAWAGARARRRQRSGWIRRAVWWSGPRRCASPRTAWPKATSSTLRSPRRGGRRLARREC
jgi:thiamine biosynthesis lipoprotein